jgi:hypothetical protein
LNEFNPQDVFSIPDHLHFNDQALKIFHLQYRHNRVYQKFVDELGTSPREVKSTTDIPFLPIELFKTRNVIWEGMVPELTFLSSGTTGQVPGRHLVARTAIYRQSFLKAFELFFGEPAQYCIFALLPSYLEQGNSSLVYMLNGLIQLTDDHSSGFYLDRHDALLSKLERACGGKKVILFGVTYALLDLVENRKLDYPDLIVIETGGMKGRRKEMVREELHDILCAGFGVKKIYSEYGMTELLSQAYSTGYGSFNTPPWMKVMARDLHDPFTLLGENKTGPLNIIDLANVYSCSFIATQDLGRINPGGNFEVLGRVDYSDIRGCNLMI